MRWVASTKTSHPPKAEGERRNHACRYVSQTSAIYLKAGLEIKGNGHRMLVASNATLRQNRRWLEENRGIVKPLGWRDNEIRHSLKF